jgi:type I site-specific restriction endonuclease
MHYNPNPRLTSESYVYPSVIITIISSRVFVYYSNGTGTWYLRNHNVQEMFGILVHAAGPLLLFVMYHTPLVAYQYI